MREGDKQSTYPFLCRLPRARGGWGLNDRRDLLDVERLDHLNRGQRRQLRQWPGREHRSSLARRGPARPAVTVVLLAQDTIEDAASTPIDLSPQADDLLDERHGKIPHSFLEFDEDLMCRVRVVQSPVGLRHRDVKAVGERRQSIATGCRKQDGSQIVRVDGVVQPEQAEAFQEGQIEPDVMTEYR